MDRSEIVALLSKRYEGNPEFDDALEYLHYRGTAIDALMYSELFWPEFSEIENVVIRRGALPRGEEHERVREVLAHYQGSVQPTERSLSYTEVPYLFGNPLPSGEIDDDGYVYLCETLREMWSARLLLLFPRIPFEVRVAEGQHLGIEFFRTSVSG